MPPRALLPFCFLLLHIASVGSRSLIALEAYVPPGSVKPVASLKPLTPEQVAKAVEMLAQPAKLIRDKAVDGLRPRWQDPGQKAQVISIFEQAISKCEAALAVELKKGIPGLGKVDTAYDTWKMSRDAFFIRIHTDFHKDPKEVAKLSEEMQALQKQQEHLAKELATGNAAWKALGETAGPLEALQIQLGKIEDSTLAAVVPLERRMNKLPGGAAFAASYGKIQTCEKAAQELASVNAFNEKSSWAPKTSILFAARLNGFRYALHLTPLRLDQALSQAATDHSAEMIKLGYFAHESPVEANKTPWIRAANAKFSGSASGENIFAGSPAPDAAYGGWWGSDGHRFIMFSEGPNTLGVGPVASHWTMMTGNRTW